MRWDKIGEDEETVIQKEQEALAERTKKVGQKLKKIERNLSTPEARAFWKGLEKTAAEVKKWPEWQQRAAKTMFRYPKDCNYCKEPGCAGCYED